LEFEPYLRLFNLQGKDWSDLPRVPDPGGTNRWMCAWETEAEAETFAEHLREHSGDSAWHVVAVDGPVSRGPSGRSTWNWVAKAMAWYLGCTHSVAE
jgi:hypothetical protein